MVGFESVVDDADDETGTADAGSGVVPDGFDVDVGSDGAAALAGIFYVPLAGDERIVGEGAAGLLAGEEDVGSTDAGEGADEGKAVEGGEAVGEAEDGEIWARSRGG